MLWKTSSSAAWIQCTRSAGMMSSGIQIFVSKNVAICSFSSDRRVCSNVESVSYAVHKVWRASFDVEQLQM